MTVRFLNDSPDFSYPLLAKAIRVALLSTAVGMGAVPLVGMAAQAGSEHIHQRYDIPAGPLSDALNQFARQAGITLASTPAQTQGLESPGLHGEYSAEQGLNYLLNGSGLQAASQDGASFVLQPLAQSSTLTLPHHRHQRLRPG
ncbi:hypothetical protein QF043_005619 [Pseudomonas sp. W3I7]|nr:hypothetical protein [Pseudomonas sp. W3I7]